jgi:cytochrome c oxidase cbb3-type subunit I
MVQNKLRAATVYSDTTVRLFALAAVVYGIVGMLVGVIIAAQLAWPELNFGMPWLSYGRCGRCTPMR